MAKTSPHLIDNAILMAEWDWEENAKANLNPQELTIGSSKKASWICSKNHKWQTAICHRTGRGSNCPYCSNKKILPGYNDLQSQRPDLMTEWDWDENIIDPSTVAIKSNKTAKWVCPKGHKYTQTIDKRSDGGECPICVAGRELLSRNSAFSFTLSKDIRML